MAAKASEITSRRLGHGRPVRSVGDRRRGLARGVLTADPVTGRPAGREWLRRGGQRLWCPVWRGISVEVAARVQAGLPAGRERGGGGDAPHSQGWAGDSVRGRGGGCLPSMGERGGDDRLVGPGGGGGGVRSGVGRLRY